MPISFNLSKKQLAIFFTVTSLFIASLSLSYLTRTSPLTIVRPGVTLRQEPSTGSQALAEIDPKSQVSLLSRNENWLKVRYQGKIDGWIPQWLLDQPELPSDQEIGLKTKGKTPLYSKADKDSPVVTELPADSFSNVQFVQADWIKIYYQDYEGFVQKNQVQLLASKDAKLQRRAKEEAEKKEAKRQATYEQLKDQLTIRQEGAYFFESPSYQSKAHYQASYLQQFTLLEEVKNEETGEVFYKAKDDQGREGYLNPMVVSQPVDSIDHKSEPKVHTLKEATLFIDPGHGGEDPGTLSLDKQFHEKDYTLPVAVKLKAKLEALGCKVILSRDQDVFVGLDQRVDMTNQSDADLFVSIHFDASWDPNWNGITTYFYHLEDENFAQAMQASISSLGQSDGGVQYGNYQVLRGSHIPAILLEMGFMSNAADLENIKSDQYQDQLAQGIVQGLESYFNQLNKNH